jgi:hypothetical protein
MRLVVAIACLGLVGCESQGVDVVGENGGWTGGMLSGNGSGDYEEEWMEPTQQYQVLFGGTFELGDDDDDGNDWTGEEYTIITDEDGTIVCDYNWDTTASDYAVPGACEDCTKSWDVVCFNGRVADGSCYRWLDVNNIAGPIQFYLSFEPGYEENGVEVGILYMRGTPYSNWEPYAPATYDGERVAYDITYDYF